MFNPLYSKTCKKKETKGKLLKTAYDHLSVKKLNVCDATIENIVVEQQFCASTISADLIEPKTGDTVNISNLNVSNIVLGNGGSLCLDAVQTHTISGKDGVLTLTAQTIVLDATCIKLLNLPTGGDNNCMWIDDLEYLHYKTSSA
jgi:hypothetical protein